MMGLLTVNNGSLRLSMQHSRKRSGSDLKRDQHSELGATKKSYWKSTLYISQRGFTYQVAGSTGERNVEKAPAS